MTSEYKTIYLTSLSVFFFNFTSSVDCTKFCSQALMYGNELCRAFTADGKDRVFHQIMILHRIDQHLIALINSLNSTNHNQC